jgi:hypothetical protein
MLIGRRTYEVGKRGIETARRGKISGEDYGGGWSGPEFVLTHRPPDPPDPAVTSLTGDIGEAVATARSAAGGKNREILGADVAGQCLRRGSSTRSWCTSCRCCSATPSLLVPGLTRINLEPVGLWQRTRPDTEYADAESGVFPHWRLAG